MEREWNEVCEAAAEIADTLMNLDTQLGIVADSLQVLIAKASDTKRDNDGLKRDMLGVWRATLENVRASQAALTARRSPPGQS